MNYKLHNESNHNKIPVLHSTLILLDIKENGSYDQSEEQGYGHLDKIKTKYTQLVQAAVLSVMNMHGKHNNCTSLPLSQIKRPAASKEER